MFTLEQQVASRLPLLALQQDSDFPVGVVLSILVWCVCGFAIGSIHVLSKMNFKLCYEKETNLYSAKYHITHLKGLTSYRISRLILERTF